jgi:dihydroneopterin aldolase
MYPHLLQLLDRQTQMGIHIDVFRVYSCSFVSVRGYNSLMINESHPFSDEIHIEQLEVSSVIGVSEHERKTPQRLTINISFWPYSQTRDMEDKIGQTINYAIVAEETQKFVHDQAVNLIETLADRLAAHLLENFPIQKITLEIRKFPLEHAKYVSARVTRSAAAG